MKMGRRIMRVLKSIILFPLHLFLKVILVAGTIVTAVSGWVFYLVGSVFLLTTICSAGFELASKGELKTMFITSLCILFVPLVSKMLLAVVEVVDSFVAGA